jgi:hypothetical protein
MQAMSTESASASSPSLFKYVTVDTLRRILTGSIRFTQPSAFNDPFELLPEIVMPVAEPERPISLSFDIQAQRRAPAVGELTEVPEGFVSSDATSRDIVRDLNKCVGILCLSKTSDSLLMWSHYADQYGGAVVEFDDGHEFFAGQIEVEYRASRPMRDLRSYLTGKPIPVAELCVKCDDWSYEREVRVFRQLAECEEAGGTDGRGFPIFVQRIPIKAIKSVTLGERTPVAYQREVFGRIMETDIALNLAAVDHAGFGFRLERIKFGVPLSKMSPMMSPRTANIFKDLQSPMGEFARWMVEKHPLSKIVNKPV